MEKKQITSREYFKTLLFVYYVLIAGQVIFGLALLLLTMTGNFDPEDALLRTVFMYLVPILAIGGIFASIKIFKSKLNVARDADGLTEKMNNYRGVLIVRFALLEGPSFFAIVSFMQTGELLFLAVSGMIVLYFFTLKPTREKAVSDLELTENDSFTINDPDAVVATVAPGK
jgi:hypothetical protein